MFWSFFHFLHSNAPDNKCDKQKCHVLFFTCIKLLTRVLACAHAIAFIKWKRLLYIAIHFTDKCIFYVKILLWKKNIVNRKLNLTWNKQTKFNKPGPSLRVFQTVLRGKGMGNLTGGIFLSGGANLTRSDFGHLNFFQS